MKVSPAAAAKLRDLYDKTNPKGGTPIFRIEGTLGSCRALKPVIKPVSEAQREDALIQLQGLTMAIARDQAENLDNAVLDYEPGFLGRGLHLTTGSCGESCNCSAKALKVGQ